MSEFLDAVCAQARKTPGSFAFRNSRGETLTYAELEAGSNGLASFLLSSFCEKRPVVLLGHKQPGMLVGMFGCMKAGMPYVPLDTSLPAQRIEGIIGQLESPVVIEVASDAFAAMGFDVKQVSHPVPYRLAASNAPAVPSALFADIMRRESAIPDPARAISGEDAQYILFTSGSTGTPKGVVQPARSMDCTYRYFSRFIPEGEALTFFNRAHYSFDLSIFDFVIALPFGHCLFALAEEEEASLAKTFAALREADVSLWVSTPSYLGMCLVDPAFSPELLPNLRSVVVCGETLHNSTALQLLERFPDAALYNTYGPTEAQGAITDVRITSEIAKRSEALPVGTVSPFSELRIAPLSDAGCEQGGESMPGGEPGEVVILGGTVATGYYGRPDLTAKAFGFCEDSKGRQVPFYRTGDEGFLDDAGMLHYLGRLDLQVKVNGYRIELGEIEETLNRDEAVLASCVVPVERQGVYTALAAHVVAAPGVPETRETGKRIKEALRKTLPAYMIPRTVKFHDALPTNVNGKVDRKALAATPTHSSRGGKHADSRGAAADAADTVGVADSAPAQGKVAHS